MDIRLENDAEYVMLHVKAVKKKQNNNNNSVFMPDLTTDWGTKRKRRMEHTWVCWSAHVLLTGCSASTLPPTVAVLPQTHLFWIYKPYTCHIDPVIMTALNRKHQTKLKKLQMLPLCASKFLKTKLWIWIAFLWLKLFLICWLIGMF